MFVHPRSRSILADIDPNVVASLMPSTRVDGPGYRVAIKHTAAATLALRDLGHEAPSPIVSYYDWPKYKGKYAPFDHQRLLAEFMTLHTRCFNLAEMGAGKTNSVLWALDWLMAEGLVRRTIITAPLSTLERVWWQSASDTIMHRRVVIVHGSREKRLALLAQDADIYIINHEGLTIKPVREAIRRMKPELFVVDEGSKFRNAKTDKYRALESLLVDPRTRLWWLTGTPTPSGPDDSWAQIRLVSPNRVPRFFGQFRARVMMEMAEHVWKPRAGAEAVVHEAMQPAIRIAKADCLDLPPLVTVDMACTMSAAQKAAYDQMAKAMQVADQAAGEQGTVITAVNAADRLNKLRQIMLGSIRSGPTEYVNYDVAPRVKVILEAIDAATSKSIVVVPFKGAIHALAAAIGKTHTVGIVNGDVGLGKRNALFHQFKTEAHPQVLLVHPAVCAHGLNLTEADTLIFAGPIYSNDEYRQVVERINRPPQDKKMTIVRVGCNAIEWAIYKSLDTDEDQQQLIMGLYRSVIRGD